MKETSISPIENVSRRLFIRGFCSAGAFVLATRVLPASAWAQTEDSATRAASAALNPSIYLGIEPDGKVFIVTHRSEMGTGIRTTLPMVAADELDADWERVTIEQGIGDRRYGDQNTDGSRSIRDFYQAFRVAGRSARTMLIEAAADQWNVPASECETGLHEVVHPSSGRRAGFGSLVEAAGSLPVPEPGDLEFKTSSEWRYVGKEFSIYDGSDIVTGKPVFGMDAERDGMVFASIEHPPVFGGTVESFDDTAALQVPGVQRTVQLTGFTPPYGFQPLGGVAVIADSTWAAFQGRKALNIQWNDGPNASYNSDEFRLQLMNTVRQPGKVVRDHGDVDAEFARGGNSMEAMYYMPHHAHAPMEPPVAVAEVRDGRAILWAPTQNPQAVQDTVAAALGITPDDVTCNVTLLGGGFGRKSKPDYCAEAAVLSRELGGTPVKVVWSREDDIQFDYFHSVAAVYHRATVDANGRPTAWLHRSAFPPIAAAFEAGAEYGMDFEHNMGLSDLPYDVANIRAENGAAQAHVRIGWFRAVTNNFHVFAASSFADEMAHAAGRDPLEFLLDMIGPGQILDLEAQGVVYDNYGAPLDRFPVDTRRLRQVLEIAGERSNWGSREPGNGWGIGIAAHRSFNSYVASVVEVEVGDDGEIRIPRVDQVVDAGLIVNPERVRAQLEGAAVMAIGFASTSEITAENGRIQQSNFHDFLVSRISDAPIETHVHLVESNELPTGVGEPGVPPVIAALANAIYSATGTRIRELPISGQNLG
jgi:isoquinoline 1-oxidoreductase beta subunit